MGKNQSQATQEQGTGAKKSYIKKLTCGTMGLDPRVLEDIAVKFGSTKKAVLRVIGRVHGATPGNSDMGPYVKFTGDFQGINLIDRSVSRSKILILPGVAESFVMEGFDGAKASDPDAVLQFGLDILVEENKSTKGGRKYKYAVTPLTDNVGKDALTLLTEQLGEVPYLQLN